GVAVVAQDLSTGKVRPRQLARVFGCLQEADRALDLAERRARLSLHQREPGQRPVEADTRVGIGRLLRSPECLADNGLRPSELAEVGERVAQIGGEANFGADVCRSLGLYLGQAVLEQLDGPPRLA